MDIQQTNKKKCTLFLESIHHYKIKQIGYSNLFYQTEQVRNKLRSIKKTSCPTQDSSFFTTNN